MGWYSHLKIGHKLLLGFTAVILITVLVGLAGVSGVRKIDEMIVDLYSSTLAQTVCANEAYSQLMTHNRNCYRHALAEEKKLREEISAEIHLNEKAIAAALARYRLLRLSGTEVELLDRFDQIWPEYSAVTDQLLALTSKRNNRETYLLAEENGQALFYKLHGLLGELVEFNLFEGKQTSEEARRLFQTIQRWLVILIAVAMGVGAGMAFFITRSVVTPLKLLFEAVSGMLAGSENKALLIEAIAAGDLSQEVVTSTPLAIDTGRLARDEAGMLLRDVAKMSAVQAIVDLSFSRMISALRSSRDEENARDWLKSGNNELNRLLQGNRKAETIAETCLSFLCEYLGAGAGALYLLDEKTGDLKGIATFAMTRRKRLNRRIAIGEGLAGQAAQEQKVICLTSVPPDYMPITFALGKIQPANIAAVPLINGNNLVGVVEIGSCHPFTDLELEFLQKARESLAISINASITRQKVDELLVKTQSQTEELRVQQEQLQQTNEELEERARILEQQREQIRAKNRAVEEANSEIQRKAEQLEKISTYKSEFLANMSHELRTPLNSLMILSGLLRDNREGNLTEKQVEYAATISSAGKDLLNLINDILDLSKIESGRLEFHFEAMSIADICDQLQSLFGPIAENRGLDFTIDIAANVPESINTDTQRTQQILKNLLANACKFTAQGAVSLHVYTPEPGKNPLPAAAVAFAVIDTGIGIPADKQQLVFNAFQQADGSTNRIYGGTGLGLSISRQLAHSLGGEIVLDSEPGQGCAFTLYLPCKESCPSGAVIDTPAIPAKLSETPRSEQKSAGLTCLEPLPAPIPDDRELLQSGSSSILVIEDDLNFARILADMIRDRGFFLLVAADGESGIALAERYKPSAIILDVMLPHIDGWGVMRNLKDNPATRHIPVHFITCLEERQKAMCMGAIGYVTKPVNKEQLDNVFGTLESSIEKSMKMLLIVEDDEAQANAMQALLEERNVTIRIAASGTMAIDLLSTEKFDCIVLDLGLADMGAFELLEEVKKLDPDRRIPVIIHTGRELTRAEETKLRHYAESIIIKGAKSPERLLNEVTLFLHLVQTSLDPDKQRMIRSAIDKEAMLEGKHILIVDDDMRNIFSLSSALAEKQMIIFEAENGREALKQLDEHPETDLVLMDIMMPEMDGYEAMRAIRKDPRFRTLPIIALTAKAMKGDREECLNAGASDYIPKPVDMEKLFSLLRVWLYSAKSNEPMDLG
jgi:CheY-like chemotaxis protein